MPLPNLTARLRSYAASLFHRADREAAISDELQFHIESRAADLERIGLTPAEALRRARIEFGPADKHREDIRASLGLRLFDELRDDLRYAIRMLRSSPGFTAVAIGSLALGIGANTIIFSLAKGVLLDRLPVPHPEQLTMVTLVGGPKSPINSSWGSWYEPKGNTTQYPLLTYPIYKMLQQQNREHPVLSDIFAFKDLGSHSRLTATINGDAELVTAQMVSGNFYDQLGVRPQIGRTIEPSDDDVPGSGNVVMISDVMWSRIFERSPDVVGKIIQLNLIPMTIVGVNPPGFTGASSVQIAPDVFFPLSMQPVLSPTEHDHPSALDDKETWWTQVMARVRPDVSPAAAQAAVTTWIDQDIRATMKLDKDVVMPKVVLMEGSRGIAETNHGFSTQVYVLSALAGLVLLLACANLANLLLARSAARQREIAVRMALGASRGRVLRQVLTESLLLSLLGGAAGLALGYLGRNVIPHMYKAPWQTSALRADFDPIIVLFATVVSILTGVLFGIAPAWQATRTSVNSGLKDAAASTTRRRKGLAGRGLVIVQIALSMLLVVGAGLFGSTLRNLYKQPLGFVPQNILLFSVQAPETRYPAPKDVQLHEKLEERLGLIPGVSAVTLSRMPLVGGGGSNSTFYPTDQRPREIPQSVAMMHNVGRTFFDLYRIPQLTGRGFNSADTSTSQPVAIINQALALNFWPNQDPIGKTFKMDLKGDDYDTRQYQVVGVVADTKYMQLGNKAPSTFYTLYNQMDSAKEMTYEIKTPLPLNDLLPQIRAAVADIDHDLPVRDVRTQQAQIDATVTQQKTFAVLTGAFGILALILACIGIYGLMAYDVSRRTSEIGIRMALGAQASQMLRMILSETSLLAIGGIAVGIGAALLLARFIRSMLFGLTPTDPLILIGSGLLLLAVALLSGWGPARRAAHIDPMEALRHE